MNNEKINFLKYQFIPLLQQLPADAKGRWGVMNAQQMVEHFSDTLQQANGKRALPLHTPKEHLPKFRQFMLNEKPFRENTKNPLMGEQAPTLKNNSMQEAIDELQEELNYFFSIFETNPNLITLNAIFGDLDYEQNIQLLYKHAQHHLKQFGLID
ncbi:MAG TPA: hypothetical protein VN958_21905 [Chitinophagaceae bacterium]|nr:hypothetical protein [Chitinophagaceae bacterium]